MEIMFHSLSILLLLCVGGLQAHSSARMKCGGVTIPDIHLPPDAVFLKSIPFQISRISFRAKYYFHPAMSRANRDSLERASAAVNERLGSVIKAAPLSELLFDKRQILDGFWPCPRTICSDEIVPQEFAVPCQNESRAKRQRMSTEYTLSVYVMVQNDGSHKDNCDHRADASPCRFDPVTFQPTHGRIFFCVQPKDDVLELITQTLLHETLHVMTGDMAGTLFPSNPGWKYGRDYRTLVKSAYNHSWIIASKSSQSPSGATSRLHYFAITPGVLLAVKEHFQCADLEGAELAYDVDDKKRRANLGHWNQQLFIDEVMSPFSFPLQRLSAITLAYLNDSGWYDVDFSKAEPLAISHPNGNGCDVAGKSCFEILDKAKRKTKLGVASSLAPYCDRNYTDFTGLRCSKDGRMRLECNTFGDSMDNCYVLHAPNYEANSIATYDHPMCKRASQPAFYESLGLKTGDCTICVTVTSFPPLLDSGLQPLCFLYECYEMNWTIVLKYGRDHNCQLRCHASEAYQIKHYRPSGKCKFTSHDSVITFVCPDYNSICRCVSYLSLEPEPNSASALIFGDSSFWWITRLALFILRYVAMPRFVY